MEPRIKTQAPNNKVSTHKKKTGSATLPLWNKTFYAFDFLTI